MLVTWESLDQTAPGTVTFDGQDFQILPGIPDQRVCLYLAYRSGAEEEAVTIIPPSLTFTVDTSAGGGSGGGAGGGGGASPPPTPPATQQKNQPAVLSSALAASKARSALKRKYGRAYTRGKKRVTCKRQSSTAYRCGFTLRYRKKRHSGNVTVRLTSNGIRAKVTAKK